MHFAMVKLRPLIRDLQVRNVTNSYNFFFLWKVILCRWIIKLTENKSILKNSLDVKHSVNFNGTLNHYEPISFLHSCRTTTSVPHEHIFVN